MKELLKDYLVHSEHYLKGENIRWWHLNNKKDTVVYEVCVENECIAVGTEVIEISLDNLLVFLHSKCK